MMEIRNQDEEKGALQSIKLDRYQMDGAEDRREDIAGIFPGVES